MLATRGSSLPPVSADRDGHWAGARPQRPCAEAAIADVLRAAMPLAGVAVLRRYLATITVKKIIPEAL